MTFFWKLEITWIEKWKKKEMKDETVWETEKMKKRGEEKKKTRKNVILTIPKLAVWLGIGTTKVRNETIAIVCGKLKLQP